MSEYKVTFEKYVTHKNKNIYKLVKTKTNKYMLIDVKTNKIVATTKKQILNAIKEYGINNNLGG